MDAWLDEIYGLIVNCFGRETVLEMYVVVALCILSGALALSRVGTSLGALRAFYFRGVLLTVVGSLLLFAAMALLPVFTYFPDWALLVVALIALLVVVVPLTILIQKGGYVAALVAWMAALLTIVVVLVLEPMAMRAIKHVLDRGAEKASQIEKHRNETEKAK